MTRDNKPEVWLRGRLPEIPDLLQPVAHALLQASEDVHQYTREFPDSLLWETCYGRASVGFHLQHLTGVLDRMISYAMGRELSEEQFAALRNEGNSRPGLGVSALVAAFDLKIGQALDVLKTTKEEQLTASRMVGRKKLPSTVIGLLFHAAEHSSRHVGQLLVSISVLKGQSKTNFPPRSE